MRSTSFLVAGLLLSSLSALSAQRGPAVLTEEVTGSAISTGYGLWREAGTLCGGGPHYRVEFRDDGVSYIPALADAPRTYSLRLRLESLRRGAVAVQPLDAQPTRHDSGALYARGSGMTERYDLGAAGVEQSFVLERPLDGQGDLVVRLRVHTELTPERTGDVSEGMRWMTPRWGGVEIGRAVAQDAHGRTFAMAMRCDGRHLDLILPASSADAAHYPLVLDPPIGTLRLLSGTRGDVNPDIAYDDSTDRYLAVWNRRISATQSEIRGHLLAVDGSPLGSLIAIETGNVVATNPTVANVNASNRFMVAWQQATSLFGPWTIFGRAVESNGAQSARISITSAAESDIDPDLGGESTTGSTTIPLVWHRVGEGVRGVRISVPSIGNPSRGLTETVIRTGAVNRPRISQSGGDRRIYAVVWERLTGSGSPRIEASAITNTVVLRGGPIVVSTSGVTSERPAVDGDGMDFMVVYERTLSPSNHDIFCSMLRHDNTTLRLTTSGRRIGAALGDQVTPAVGWLGPKYLVAWADNANRGGFLDHDLHLLSLSPGCEVCGQEHVVRQLTAAYDHDPAIATQRSAGSSGTEAIVAFSVIDRGLVQTSVRVQRFNAFGNGGTSSVVGPGCGNGGTLSFDGPVAYGNVDLRVDLRGADSAAMLAALFLGFTNRTTSCGSCTTVDPFVAQLAAISNGAASVSLPLSCSLLALGPGLTVDLQWVTIGGAGSSCTLVPSLATSDRVRMTVGF